MSVINKMLRDLDQQNAAFESKNYHPPVKKITSLRWVILACLLIVLSGATLVLFSDMLFKDTAKQKDGIVQVTPKVTQDQLAIKENSQQQPAVPVTKGTTSTDSTSISEKHQNPFDTKVSDPLPQTTPAPATKLVTTASEQNTQKTNALPAKKPSAVPAPENPSIDDTKNATNSSFSLSRAQQVISEDSLQLQISSAIKSGQTGEAIALLEQLKSIEPFNVETDKKLASLYFSNGQTEKAQQVLLNALDNAKNNDSVRVMLARLYSQQNKPQEALNILEIDYPSTNEDLIAYRAAMAQQVNKDELALDNYLQLTKINPEEPKWWLGHAVLADKLDYKKDAVVSYQTALKLGGLEVNIENFIQERMKSLARFVNETK